MRPLEDSGDQFVGNPIIREEERRPHDPVSPLALWAGALTPPLAVLLAQLASYAFVPPVCEDGLSPIFIHLPHLLMLVASAVATWASYLHYRRFAHAHDEGYTVAARSKLIAAIGAFGGPYFALIIIAMWAALAIIGQCQ